MEGARSLTHLHTHTHTHTHMQSERPISATKQWTQTQGNGE